MGENENVIGLCMGEELIPHATPVHLFIVQNDRQSVLGCKASALSRKAVSRFSMRVFTLRHVRVLTHPFALLSTIMQNLLDLPCRRLSEF